MSSRPSSRAGKDPAVVGAADIVTNSGQVRPLDAAMIGLMKPSSVIPLMYESWEFREADVDLAACRARGIMVGGTNERHPGVDVFSFLGQMAVMQLHEAGIPVRGCELLLLCDNSFASFIRDDLERAGADVTLAAELTADALSPRCDGVVLALQPRAEPVFTAGDAELLGRTAPGAVLVQYWGDADRAALSAAGVPVWPPRPPRAGHMGVLPSAVGPEPIVRLQAGGLKAGQVLARGLDEAAAEDLAYVQVLWPRHPAASLAGHSRRLSREEIMNTVLLLGMGPTALSALESLAARFRMAGLVREVGSPPGGSDEVLARLPCTCWRRVWTRVTCCTSSGSPSAPTTPSPICTPG